MRKEVKKPKIQLLILNSRLRLPNKSKGLIYRFFSYVVLLFLEREQKTGKVRGGGENLHKCV